MNYPVWQLDFAGGGLLIALIATIHVFIAQFAVGGGLFLVLTEIKGRRENNRQILEYVQRHARFFLVLTMVLGSLTGIGIWFTISLLSPAATSTLIHNFVFAWAIEWLFFLVEIISIFIYTYTFDRLTERDHLRVGWIYAVSAWLSLFFVSGIIDFMLTPGAWLQTGSFWDGFFNPTFWPALFFRTFLSLILAGLFGFLTACTVKEVFVRHSLMRYCATWLLVPVVLLLGAAWWYASALPPEVGEMIFHRMPFLTQYIRLFAICSPLIVLGGLIMAIRMPAGVNRVFAVVMLLIGFCYLGAFEFIREGGRRPYIIRDHMYANSIFKKDISSLAQTGVIKAARWVEQRPITDSNRVLVGKELFMTLCLSCHSIGGPMNNILPRTEQLGVRELDMILGSMGRGYPYMPPFIGTAEEQRALTAFLTTALHNRREEP
ncbi:MAG: cytochrome ubiquinol oxidase subunit I [Proteobacteria bacterium]|nr:cytochrome C [Desulfobulbaceae bacterium]MBU4152310.1 cytochrome ubiquinol oxidase subunit I [Pseudomonadota bacterium]